MPLTNVDLRHVETGVTLTRAERMAAEMRHLAAMNDAQLAEKKARNARRGLGPMQIGAAHVPDNVARAFTRVKVA